MVFPLIIRGAWLYVVDVNLEVILDGYWESSQ